MDPALLTGMSREKQRALGLQAAQEQHNNPQQLFCKRTIHPGGPRLENMICHDFKPF